MLVGARLGVSKLRPELRKFGLQGRNLLLEEGDLALLKAEVGLNRRGGERTNLGRQARLLVHDATLPTGSPSGLPYLNDYIQ